MTTRRARRTDRKFPCPTDPTYDGPRRAGQPRRRGAAALRAATRASPTQPYWFTIGGAIERGGDPRRGGRPRDPGGDRDRGRSRRAGRALPPRLPRVLLERPRLPRQDSHFFAVRLVDDDRSRFDGPRADRGRQRARRALVVPRAMRPTRTARPTRPARTWSRGAVAAVEGLCEQHQRGHALGRPLRRRPVARARGALALDPLRLAAGALRPRRLLAHANALHRAGLLTDDDHGTLLDGLAALRQGTTRGRCARAPPTRTSTAPSSGC